MELILTPVRCDRPLEARREGAALVLNGQRLDFADLAEGAALDPADLGCDWIAGPVSRRDGVLRVPLLLPHGPDAPAASRAPAPLRQDADGPVALPSWGAKTPGTPGTP